MSFFEKLTTWFKNLFKKSPAPRIEPPKPIDSPPIETPSTYEERVFVEYRDRVGIKGACTAAKKHKADYIIECHFNSYNGQAGGYLVLTNNHSTDFARAFLNHMEEYYPGRKNRGIDTSPARGGNNIKYCSGNHFNILIEPFFGDNVQDCIDQEKMIEILASFIQKLKGRIVLIVGHTEASSGAYSRKLKKSEYNYWKEVCSEVMHTINNTSPDTIIESPSTEDSLSEFEEIKNGWHKKYETFIERELRTDKYPHLRSHGKTDYWIAFFHALAMAESGCDPFSTYWESKLGTPPGYDSATHMKYLSEGLFQLSYSDALYYKCDFDIEGDRKKDPADPTKTIFRPCSNIKCALTILNKLVGKHGTPIYNSGHYWAVLKPRNSRHKVFLKYFNKYYS